MTEDQHVAATLGLCRLLHLRTLHIRPARTADGWRTPVQGDGKGFPDLLIVGENGVLFRELKSRTGKLTADQMAWVGSLTAARQNVGVWRPADWPDVVRAELEALAHGR
jgi:hypothetical protein